MQLRTLALLLGALVTLSLGRPAHADPQPDLHLLTIGVSDYPRHPAGDRDLPLADDDALGLKHWALGQRGHLYGEVHVRELLNAQATRGEIEEALHALLLKARPGDQVIIYFAGHGVLEGDEFYFLPADVEWDRIVGSGVRQSTLMAELRASADRGFKLLFLVDACHGGALTESGASRSVQFVPAQPKRLSEVEVHQREALWALLSASSSVELAGEGAPRLPWEPESIQGHGYFTHALLRAFGSAEADRSEDGITSFSEIVAFVQADVRIASDGAQEPQVSGRISDARISWIPGTQERCDGRDNDLDGKTDEGFDLDADGIADCLERELCNGVDDNGKFGIDEGFDRDGDGYLDREACGLVLGSDCDDDNEAVHPGQPDWDNLRDDDCDGFYDEDGLDLDGDGVTDAVGTKLRHTNINRLGTAGLAVVLGGLAGWARADALTVTDLPCYGLSPTACSEISAAESYYIRRNRQSLALGIGAGLSLGASVGFHFELSRERGFYLSPRPILSARVEEEVR